MLIQLSDIDTVVLSHQNYYSLLWEK